MRIHPPFCFWTALLSPLCPAVDCPPRRALVTETPRPPRTLRGVDGKMVGPAQLVCSSTFNGVEWWTERSRFLSPFRWIHGSLRLSCGCPSWTGEEGVERALTPQSVDTTTRAGISLKCLLFSLEVLGLYHNMSSTLMVDGNVTVHAYIRLLFLGVVKRSSKRAPLRRGVDEVSRYILQSGGLYFNDQEGLFKFNLKGEAGERRWRLYTPMRAMRAQ